MTSLISSSLDEFESVQVWRSSHREFWRGAELEEVELSALERFVSFCEADPDEIIGEVLQSQAGSDKVMLKTRARRKYIQLIDDFEAAEKSRRVSNGVRSFMIHNGVAMNPSILR